MVVSSVKTYPRYGVLIGPRLGTGLQFNSISHSMTFCQAFFSVFCKLFSDFSVKSFSTFSPFCCGKLFLPDIVVFLACFHKGAAGAYLMYYKLHYSNIDAGRFLWYTNMVSAALLKTSTDSMEWMFYGFFQGRFRSGPDVLQGADGRANVQSLYRRVGAHQL